MTSKPKSVLQLRTQEKIKQLLLEMFSKSEMTLGGKSFSISINDVDISPDLRNLKIYIDMLNIDKDTKLKVIKSLNKEGSHAVKNLLAKNIKLRYVPDFIFLLDESGEKLFKMTKIIEKESQKFKS